MGLERETQACAHVHEAELLQGGGRMTELMKRYEAETDEIATWHWHDREFLTDDYIVTIGCRCHQHQKENRYGL